ncbi:HD domain-containing protein [Lactococcus cremoris]|uniref:HD domain-containing protein n=1 Tax=Lactococcus cremoris subsp. tructae TaxID=542833 RepID=A0A2A5SYX4_LACLC|nr:HD domain-containing protein [Lactococcus cremoris]PCS21048.1 hypothetical protein RU92_GL000696 [Lactococcus cremoris subsp. tructae]
MDELQLIEEVRLFLRNDQLFEHCLAVAKTAEQLVIDYSEKSGIAQKEKLIAKSTDENLKLIFTDGVQQKEISQSISKSQAFVAGLLHDIGGVYPNHQRVEKAELFGIELLTEEREFPLIIHQKLSKYLAREYFKITDENILSAIECHTTLKENFTELDLIVFLADKISWDGGDNVPFKEGLLTALSVNLQSAALYYIDFIINDGLKVAHPWLLEAKKDLENQLS